MGIRISGFCTGYSLLIGTSSLSSFFAPGVIRADSSSRRSVPERTRKTSINCLRCKTLFLIPLFIDKGLVLVANRPARVEQDGEQASGVFEFNDGLQRNARIRTAVSGTGWFVQPRTTASDSASCRPPRVRVAGRKCRSPACLIQGSGRRMIMAGSCVWRLVKSIRGLADED